MLYPLLRACYYYARKTGIHAHFLYCMDYDRHPAYIHILLRERRISHSRACASGKYDSVNIAVSHFTSCLIPALKTGQIITHSLIAYVLPRTVYDKDKEHKETCKEFAYYHHAFKMVDRQYEY